MLGIRNASGFRRSPRSYRRQTVFEFNHYAAWTHRLAAVATFPPNPYALSTLGLLLLLWVYSSYCGPRIDPHDPFGQQRSTFPLLSSKIRGMHANRQSQRNLSECPSS